MKVQQPLHDCVLINALIKYLHHCGLDRSNTHHQKKGILGFHKCIQMEGDLQSVHVKRQQPVINHFLLFSVPNLSCFVFTSAFLIIQSIYHLQ